MTDGSATGGRLAGRVSIVTGASGQLGTAQVSAIHREGAAVLATDIARSETFQGDERVAFMELDVRSENEWAAVVDEAERRFGTVSILVNNAAIREWGGLLATSPESYRRQYEVNALGTFLGMRAVVESMCRAGRGSIINISSIGGMTGSTKAFGYNASKWAVRGMTKSAALELAPRSIRVNSIHPGPIGGTMKGGGGPARDRFPPLGRNGSADEVAALVVYLASDESGFTTGAEHLIDGGLTAGHPLAVPDPHG